MAKKPFRKPIGNLYRVLLSQRKTDVDLLTPDGLVQCERALLDASKSLVSHSAEMKTTN